LLQSTSYCRADRTILLRHSDCGGGGGIRLGTGKWRSKELFKEGKKTCSLRHQRLGAFPEMEYQIWKNTDLPREELEEISQKCGEMFTNQMLGGQSCFSLSFSLLHGRLIEILGNVPQLSRYLKFWKGTERSGLLSQRLNLTHIVGGTEWIL